MDDLRERLELLEDERAITKVLYRYGDSIDHGYRDEFIDCFTPDADYVVDMRFDQSIGFTVRGHDVLGGYFDRHTHAPAAFHKHVTVNPSITVDGPAADVKSYFMRVDSPASGPAVVLASGLYLDRFARCPDGRWRIRSRTCEVENR
jgi:hypothetical protein